MSADDSMELDYGLPPTQPAFIQLSHPVVDKRTRIGWLNSQSSSQTALASLFADVDGDTLDDAPPPILETLPEFPVASTSASTSTHRPDRRRRRVQHPEPEPAHAPSAVVNLLDLFARKLPEQSATRPQKENRYEREKQHASSASSALSRSKPHLREASGSSAASSGPQTPDSDISRPWPAPQPEGATSNGGASARTRSLGSGQLPTSSATASASIRHHSLPEMGKRLQQDNDVSMGVTSDGCSMTDAFARAALDSPTSAVAAWPSPVTEKSSPAPDRSSYLDSSDISHPPLDTSVLPDTSRLLPPNLQRRPSSPAAPSHRASGATRPSSRTSSSSTIVPTHRSRDSTPQATTTSAAPLGGRSLKRTGSRTLSRDDIYKAIALAPPSPEVTRRAPASRQSAPPGQRAMSHAPAPSQRPKTLGMRRGIKPYGASTTKRPPPQLPAPASQRFRIQGFEPPFAKKPATSSVIPKPERASTPPGPPLRKQIQVPTPDSSQPQRKAKVEVDDVKMPDVGDSSFGDVSFGIDADTLDQAMVPYD
ncbi:unnamed protein product [Peniophora sp. CBMAI 1063]|nr:unnamed protein product [Peniophora sp. CBMAI 1063]